MKLGIVILAAGQGTRMCSNLPKVLHSLAGKPLLRHVLDTAAQLNPTTIVVVHGHGGEKVLAQFHNAPVQWVQQAQQLGTGHAVQQAMPQLTAVDQVLILYGDVPMIAPTTLQKFIDNHNNGFLGIITAQLSDPKGYGRVIRTNKDNGRIVRIVEEKDGAPHELAIKEINTGIMLADRKRLVDWLSRINNKNAQGEFYLTDVIALAVADGLTVSSVQPQRIQEVMGINDLMQLATMEHYLQQLQAQVLMQQGVTFRDPNRFDLRGELKAGRDVIIDINVIIEGEVIIEEGVHIGPNCLLRNCRIGANTQIYANSIIEEASIGPNARIGPFARVRPGCEIAAAAHIGNFVELKNAHIGAGSKANHLSYLGDCEIGERVNIGAGTITCNYDGVNKHKTIIDDDAFIGSNTALVAPVTIGNEATIGAGSVINKNAPAAKLTLTRPPQRTVEGWNRPQKIKADN